MRVLEENPIDLLNALSQYGRPAARLHEFCIQGCWLAALPKQAHLLEDTDWRRVIAAGHPPSLEGLPCYFCRLRAFRNFRKQSAKCLRLRGVGKFRLARIRTELWHISISVVASYIAVRTPRPCISVGLFLQKEALCQ